MRLIVIIFVLIPFLLVVDACKVSVKKETEIVKYYDDGKVESRFFLVNGKKNGEATLYHKNGQIKQRGNWKDDKQEGVWLFYYDNGQISEKIPYKNDLQDGWAVFYYPDGSLNQEGNFTKGIPEGISKIYYRGTNKVKELSNWSNGKRNGEETIFDSIGPGSKKYIWKDDVVVKSLQ